MMLVGRALRGQASGGKRAATVLDSQAENRAGTGSHSFGTSNVTATAGGLLVAAFSVGSGGAYSYDISGTNWQVLYDDTDANTRFGVLARIHDGDSDDITLTASGASVRKNWTVVSFGADHGVSSIPGDLAIAHAYADSASHAPAAISGPELIRNLLVLSCPRTSLALAVADGIEGYTDITDASPTGSSGSVLHPAFFAGLRGGTVEPPGFVVDNARPIHTYTLGFKAANA